MNIAIGKLLALEKLIDAEELPKSDKQGVPKQGRFIIDLFNKIGVTALSQDLFQDYLDDAILFLQNTEDSNNRPSGLQHINKAFKTAFSGIPKSKISQKICKNKAKMQFVEHFNS